jgi:hypothetical protein
MVRLAICSVLLWAFTATVNPVLAIVLAALLFLTGIGLIAALHVLRFLLKPRRYR